MSQYVLIAFLIILSLNEISAQSMVTFKKALFKDLDISCILEKGEKLDTAISTRKQCIRDALDDLHSRRHEIDHDEERVKLLCQTQFVSNCTQKMLNIILSCLPENDHETINQIIKIDNAHFVSLCENDAEDYKTLLKSSCDKKFEMLSKLKACEEKEIDEESSITLSDYFSDENCKKYTEGYECKIEATTDCEDTGKAFKNMYDAMMKASPCHK